MRNNVLRLKPGMIHYAPFVRWLEMRDSALRVLALATGLFLLAFTGLGSVAHAADPNKVIRASFPTGETGFDPARVSDLYSNAINEAIFERLLSYDYLARPAKLVPMVAEAMPEVGDNGKLYTFKLKKGIYFTPDPAFKGQKRELTAQDFVYSFMRFLDPKNRSPYAFLIEGKIVGLDALVDKAKKSGKFDYDAKVAGMQAVDRYTLRFHLTATDYNFPYITAHVPYGAVAREAIEAYGEDTMGHPVGTGPYMLKSWSRAAKIVLEAIYPYTGNFDSDHDRRRDQHPARPPDQAGALDHLQLAHDPPAVRRRRARRRVRHRAGAAPDDLPAARERE